MELSWLMKLRIAAAAATGIALIGLLAWPLAAPQPFGAVSVLAGNITAGDTIILATLALLSGFIGYFLSWPYGREVGILAVPSGLAIWSVRSGSMADLMRLNQTLHQRQTLFAGLKWEPLFWLAIVAAGFAGVLIAQKINPGAELNNPDEKSQQKSNTYLNVIIALIGSVLIALFCIRIFAQDVRIFDSKLGSVVAQPAVGQIVFAVLVSFAIAGFIVKKFFGLSYIWPAIASSLVTGFAVITYAKQDILGHLVEHHPAAFFSNAAISILPVQMVTFGTLGSIAGFWMAVRFDYWRKHEI